MIRLNSLDSIIRFIRHIHSFSRSFENASHYTYWLLGGNRIRDQVVTVPFTEQRSTKMHPRRCSNTISKGVIIVTSLVICALCSPCRAQVARGNTYCEVLWGALASGTLTVSWNGTTGDCPTSPGFYDLTEEDVRSVHGADEAQIVGWNGIRQWTLDALVPQEQVDAEDIVYHSYGNMFPDGSGLLMREAATFPIPIGGMRAYTSNYVARSVTAVWKSGTEVYELVAPNCTQIYTMQSFMYGRPGDWYVKGGEEALPTLAEDRKIFPPKGWIYRTRILDADLVIEGFNGTTEVLADDLKNSYSLHDSVDVSICPDIGEGNTSPAGNRNLKPIILMMVIALCIYVAW